MPPVLRAALRRGYNGRLGGRRLEPQHTVHRVRPAYCAAALRTGTGTEAQITYIRLLYNPED